jgi:uncharacterized membrane protein
MIHRGRRPAAWRKSALRTLWVLAFAGCAAPEGDRTPAREGESEAPAEAEPLPETGTATDPARFTGILTVEGGAEITLCDGGAYPVDGPASLTLLEVHASLAPGAEPMEGIFVDVLGEIRDEARGPWLDALEVRRAAWEGWGCGTRDDGIIYRASGTEPYWSLSVADSVAEWSTPEGLEQFVHDGPYPMTRGGWALDGETDRGATLRAEFHDEPCRDAMSGAYSHLTAEVSLGGVEYRGCAYRAPEAANRG